MGITSKKELRTRKGLHKAKIYTYPNAFLPVILKKVPGGYATLKHKHVVFGSYRNGRVYLWHRQKGFIIYESKLLINGTEQQCTKVYLKKQNLIVEEYSKGWKRNIVFLKRGIRDFFVLSAKPRSKYSVEVKTNFLRKDFQTSQPFTIIGNRTYNQLAKTSIDVSTPMPVIIDPVVTVSASSYDGYLKVRRKNAGNYHTCTSAYNACHVGDYITDGGSYLMVGGAYYEDYDDCASYRSWLIFDTSFLQPEAKVVSVSVNFYVSYLDKPWDKDPTCYLYNRGNGHPSIPLSCSDWQSGNSRLKTFNAQKGWNSLSVSSSAVNKGGYSSVQIRPSTVDGLWIHIDSAEGDNPPYLEIYYRRPPNKPTNLQVDTQTNPTISGQPSTFSFTYSHPDNVNAQSAQLQIYRDSSMSVLVYDSGTIDISGIKSGDTVEISNEARDLQDGTYYWRVKTQDTNGLWSYWSDENAFFVLTDTHVLYDIDELTEDFNTGELNDVEAKDGQLVEQNSVIFYDDFESGSFSTKGWTVSGTADVTTHTAKSGTHSAAKYSDAGYIQSPSIDLSSASSATLYYWIRRGSDDFSENPESGEDLVVEYYASNGSWKQLASYDGGGTPGEIYDEAKTLPADALHSNFKVRFRQLKGSGGSYDYWHIDDVKVKQERPGDKYRITTYDLSSLGYTLIDSYIKWVGGGTVNTYSRVSTDGGSTWEGWSEDSSENAIAALANISSLDNVKLQIKTVLDSGAYIDRLEVWVKANANLPPAEPTSLETNNQTNPHLVNTSPEFSAVYNDPDSGDVTRNAEVQIATDSDFANIIWDSGKISISDTTTGSRCPNIPYTGDPLATGTYYWRIKFWDDDDTEGAWSTETAYFVIATTVNQTLSSTARISGTKSVLTQSHAHLFDVMHSTLTSTARLRGRSSAILVSSADVRGSKAAILSSSSKIIIFEYRSIGSNYALIMHNIIESVASIKRGFPGLGVDRLGSKICSNASESRYSILKSIGKVISTDYLEIVSSAKLFDTGSSAISGFARLQAQIASVLSACARLRAGLYKSLQSHAHIYAHLSALAHSHARLFGYVHLTLSSDSRIGGATGEQLPSNARIYGTRALAQCSRARVRARLSQDISTDSRIWSFVSQQIKSSARLRDFKSLEIGSSSRLRGYVEVNLNTTTRVRGPRKTLITSTARLFCDRQTYIPTDSRIQGAANTEITSYSRIRGAIYVTINSTARIKGAAISSLITVANVDAPELCKQLGNTQFGSGPIERYGILASNVSLTFKDIELLSSNARLSSTRSFVLSSNSKLTSVNSQTLSSSARINTTRFVVIQSAYSLGPTERYQSLASNAVLYPGIHIASAARLVGTRELALTSGGSISPGRQIATHGTARIKADIHTTVPSSTRIAGATTTTLHSAAVIAGLRTATLESVARLESSISIASAVSVTGYGEKLASKAVVMSELRYGIPLGTRFECPKYWCRQLRSDAKMSGVAVIRLKSHATIGIERRQFIGSDARIKAPDSARISSEIRLRGYRSAFLESAALLIDSLYNHIQSSAYLWDYAMSYDVEEAVSFEVWYSEDSD